MGTTADGGRTATRTMALAVGAVVASVLLVTTAAIASTYTAQRVASNARALHWANSTLGTAALARASIGQAVFFGVDEGIGVASPAAADTAVATARRDLEILGGLVDGSADGTYSAPGDLREAVVAFIATGTTTLDLIVANDPSAAADHKAVELDPAFTVLADDLSAQQQGVSASISATETLAGRIDTITRIGIMLVLPALAFALYRRRARQSIENARTRHAADLEVQRRSATAKDEFFAAVSHELRTPLTTILGFSEVLMDGSARPDEQHEMVGLIRRDAIDLERRIDDLVTAARSAADDLKPTISDLDAPEAVSNAIGRADRGDGVLIETEPARIRADAAAVNQILRNLLSNAHRHGGDRIWVSGRVIGDRYLVTVSDDGPGFEAGALDAAHGPFAHDHRQAILEGTIGLGLTAAVALAEANNGSLAYRRVSGWTQVGLFLPLAAAAGRPASVVDAIPEAATA
jgi:signal transduction histidine kinase